MLRYSTGEGKRFLLAYDELFKLDVDDSIILFQHHNPIWAKKYPYELHPESKKLRAILPGDIPDITDKKARQAMRDEENAFVAEYLRKHPLDGVDRSYRSSSASGLGDNPLGNLASSLRKNIGSYTSKKSTLKTPLPAEKRVEPVIDFDDDFFFEPMTEIPYDNCALDVSADNSGCEQEKVSASHQTAEDVRNELSGVLDGLSPIVIGDTEKPVRSVPVPPKTPQKPVTTVTPDKTAKTVPAMRFNSEITQEAVAAHGNMPPAKKLSGFSS